MFAIVNFNFIGNIYKNNTYTFKTDVKNLVEGDIVVVEGIEIGETVLAVFVRYKKQDGGQERKSLLKRAHKNTLKSLIEKGWKCLKT